MARKHTDLSRTSEFPIIPRLIATSFGAGFLPVAPGTWGAIVAIILWLPLWLLCHNPMTVFWVTLAATVVYNIPGTWASTMSEKYWGKDPVVACADETVGQWLTMLPLSALPQSHWWEILLALALFRFFDIFKPLGIRSMERFPGGWGMMADDLLAGLYSAVILLALNLIIL